MSRTRRRPHSDPTRRRRRRLRRIAAVPAALVVVSALTGAGCVPDPPVVTSVTYRGALANPGAPDIRRDGAATARIGSKVVWAYGDTFTVGTSGFWSSTAALANPSTPLVISEPTTTIDGHVAPASRLVPLTSGEVAWEAAVPDSHFLYWPSSVIPDPGNNSGVVYSNHLYKPPTGDMTQLGVNISELDSGGDTTGDNLGDILTGAARQFVHGIFLDTTTQTVYLYDCEGAIPNPFTGEPGLCKVAKVARASMRTASAYRFWDGSAWVASAAAAVPTVPGAGAGTLSVQWNPHLEAYVMLTMDGALKEDPGSTSIPGLPGYSVDWIALRIRTAYSPTAPRADWSAPVTVCGTPASSPPAGCTWDLEDTIAAMPYAVRLQYPLSNNTTGETIAFSYYQPMGTPTDWFAGEVRVYDIALA